VVKPMNVLSLIKLMGVLKLKTHNKLKVEY